MNNYEAIAFDPGIANTGMAYRVGDKTGHRAITTDSGLPLAARIVEIVFSLTPFSGGDWDYCVIEDYVGSFGNDTKKEIGALIAATMYSRNFYIVHPRVWVRELFPKSKDNKKAAMRLARKLGLAPATQHEADAICLLEWGRRQFEKACKQKA
jgi:hypothetical protein